MQTQIDPAVNAAREFYRVDRASDQLPQGNANYDRASWLYAKAVPTSVAGALCKIAYVSRFYAANVESSPEGSAETQPDEFLTALGAARSALRAGQPEALGHIRRALAVYLADERGWLNVALYADGSTETAPDGLIESHLRAAIKGLARPRLVAAR